MKKKDGDRFLRLLMMIKLKKKMNLIPFMILKKLRKKNPMKMMIQNLQILNWMKKKVKIQKAKKNVR